MHSSEEETINDMHDTSDCVVCYEKEKSERRKEGRVLVGEGVREGVVHSIKE